MSLDSQFRDAHEGKVLSVSDHDTSKNKSFIFSENFPILKRYLKKNLQKFPRNPFQTYLMMLKYSDTQD